MNAIRSYSSKHGRGFTIVELLVVIVVIAVLAAISVVAYNGIQTRAQKNNIAANVNVYRKALSLYKAENGVYPTVPDDGYCLGSGYVDRTGDSVADCRWYNSTSIANVDSAFNASISKYVNGTNPIIGGSPVYRVAGDGVSGMWLYSSAGQSLTLDGVAQNTWIVYVLPDQSGCIVKPSTRITTYPAFVTDNNASYTEQWGSGALCWVPLT